MRLTKEQLSNWRVRSTEAGKNEYAMKVCPEWRVISDLLDTIDALRQERDTARTCGEALIVCDCHTWPTVKELHAYVVACEQKLDALRQEVRKQLTLIAGMCGNPDAAEACRLIIKKCRGLTDALTPGSQP